MTAPANERDDDPMLQLNNQLCFAVYSTAHTFNRIYKPLLEPLGLTYPQYLVMLVLWEEDGATVKAIGDKLHLDSGTLTPLLKRMETAGHITRTRDSADERQVRIALTPAGRALKAKAKSVPTRILAATGRSVADIKALKAEIMRLQDSINQAVH